MKCLYKNAILYYNIVIGTRIESYILLCWMLLYNSLVNFFLLITLQQIHT